MGAVSLGLIFGLAAPVIAANPSKSISCGKITIVSAAILSAFPCRTRV
ncbi:MULTISPECIES: hypothetical protein [unclassified Microcoleus]